MGHLSPRVVRLVALAGFPEVMAPEAVNKNWGDLRRTDMGVQLVWAERSICGAVRALAQRTEGSGPRPWNLQEGRRRAGTRALSGGEDREN